MKVNGLFAEFNMPKARPQKFRKSDGIVIIPTPETDPQELVGAVEMEQSLPEYNQQPVYMVDNYPACPDSWMRGSATASSYFVGVEAEHGMWLDFNRNRSHTHHVAVLISVQGVSPLTAQPTRDNKLEQYKTNCPVHNIPFEAERYCPACKYKWPPQNYLASNATPGGLLWLDGFLTKEGVVRQYVFTKDQARGVAAQIIGNQRVFAIGISFYLSKQPKPLPRFERPRYRSMSFLSDATLGEKSIGCLGGDDNWDDIAVADGVAVEPQSYTSFETLGVHEPVTRGALRSRGARKSLASRERLEVAAGAKISQRVYEDPESLDFWQSEPAGTLYINYAPVELVQEILAAGMADRDQGGEGPLAGLKVGHPAHYNE